MADKNIRKEPKKKKKTDTKDPISSLSSKPVMPQPELVKKKPKE
jgi:hypothetical protein